MAGFSAEKFALFTGRVAVRGGVCEAFVFASPFCLILVKIAQTKLVALDCGVGKSQTDDQWSV